MDGKEHVHVFGVLCLVISVTENLEDILVTSHPAQMSSKNIFYFSHLTMVLGGEGECKFVNLCPQINVTRRILL